MQFQHLLFFFDFFRNCRAFGGAPTLQGAGHDIVDFGGIWGRIFFDQKSTFFNFDFDKTWFGGGLDPLAVDFFLRTFIFSLRAL